MEKIKFPPPLPLPLREVLPVIDHTGLYPKKRYSEFLRRGFVVQT